MSDILIRNVDPALKRAVKARARANARSLSEEIKALLDRDLGRPASEAGVGSWLGTLIPAELWEQDVFFPIGAMVDNPPDFS